MLIVGSVTFSEFFLLTLYLQDVLHYSAVQSGVAFAGFALTVVVVSNLAQVIVNRAGVRVTLVAGLLTAAASLAWLTRLPLHGHYFWDLFPGFVLGGAGLGLSFVPVTIAGLAGVDRTDAGIASGLVNTSRQIGGAIGIAVASAIAASVGEPLRVGPGRQRSGPRPRLPDGALRSDRPALRRHRCSRRARAPECARAGRGARDRRRAVEGGGMRRRLDGASQRAEAPARPTLERA